MQIVFVLREVCAQSDPGFVHKHVARWTKKTSGTEVTEKARSAMCTRVLGYFGKLRATKKTSTLPLAG